MSLNYCPEMVILVAMQHFACQTAIPYKVHILFCYPVLQFLKLKTIGKIQFQLWSTVKNSFETRLMTLFLTIFIYFCRVRIRGQQHVEANCKANVPNSTWKSTKNWCYVLEQKTCSSKLLKYILQGDPACFGWSKPHKS